MKLSELKINPKNPRLIKGDKFNAVRILREVLTAYENPTKSKEIG